jgi:hypothetical protein
MPNKPNQAPTAKPDAKARDARPMSAEDKAREAKAHSDKGTKSGSGKGCC